MEGARGATGLLAGIVLLDVLLNLPGFSLGSPFASLLVPSLDLLIVLAVLLTVARGSLALRRGFALGVSIVLGLTTAARAYLRWGAPQAGSLLILAAAALGAGVGSFFLCRLVVRGFGEAILRNLFLLVAASCAVVQALLGVRIFSASGMPGLLRAVGNWLA